MIKIIIWFKGILYVNWMKVVIYFFNINLILN